MLKVVIEGNRARILPPLPNGLLNVYVSFEGQKRFLNTGGFSFEPTHYNLRLLKETFPDVEVDDNRATIALFAHKGHTPEAKDGGWLYPLTGGVPYKSRTEPYGKFQTEATEHCLNLSYGGLLMEQGTGKTKCAVDVAGTRYANGQITGVIVFTFNGVHHQWIEEGIPDHLGPMVPWRGQSWEPGDTLSDWTKKTDKLAFFTINFEAAISDRGMAACEEFINAHSGRVLAIVDESQRIKNPDAKSSQAIVSLGRYCLYRMILTGTPLAKDLTDFWAQFLFLDDSVLGHKYKSTFRAEFCRMHPKIHGVVVGSKNEKKLYDIISPFTYRVTKAEALPDLPKKMYDRVFFELHPEQRKLYDSLKRDMMAELDSGKKVTIKHAFTMVLRLQQVANGFISLDKENPEDDTQWEDLPWNPRLTALQQLRKARQGKVVIWCRYRRDVENVLSKYNTAVSYFGGTGKDERIENKLAFVNDNHITEFVSNPSVGGTGVDGLQKVAQTAIYYSNSYNSLHRWQSEDRTHRIGMMGSCTYFDLIARNTVDLPILGNLRKKKQLSDLMLDDIRLWLMSQLEMAA